MIKGKLVNIKRLIVKTENTIKENNGELKGMELVRCHSVWFFFIYHFFLL